MRPGRMPSIPPRGTTLLVGTHLKIHILNNMHNNNLLVFRSLSPHIFFLLYLMAASDYGEIINKIKIKKQFAYCFVLSNVLWYQ